jgi:hypothetical protein
MLIMFRREKLLKFQYFVVGYSVSDNYQERQQCQLN